MHNLTCEQDIRKEGTLFALIGLQATKKGPLKMYAKPQAKPPLRNKKLFFFPVQRKPWGAKPMSACKIFDTSLGKVSSLQFEVGAAIVIL